MADDDDRKGGNPQERALAERERAGVPETFFAGLYRRAAENAADPARRDPQGANLPWVAMGPRNVGGRIRALAQDRVNTSTIYAGSGFGGLWKTDNSGDTWRPLGGFLQGLAHKELAPPIGAVAISSDRNNNQILYVGTGEPLHFDFPGIGLYFSNDGGVAFTEVDAPTPASTIRAERYERIIIDPWEAGGAWIACEKGLWRSIPGATLPGAATTPPTFGTNDFISVTPGGAGVQDVTDVAIDFGNRSAVAPAGPFTIYAAIRGDGIYRAAFDVAANAYLDLNAANHPFRNASAAAGVRWKKLSGPFPDAITDSDLLEQGMGRIKLTLCVAAARHLYAVFCLADSKASPVFASVNGGDNWTETGSRPGDDDDQNQAYYDLVVEAHPDRPDIAIVGIVDLFLTTNGGESWTKIIDGDNYDSGDRAQHADQHALLFDRADPRAIWVGNDGGISYSKNLGRTWRKRSYGILAVQFYDVTIHPTYPYVTGGGFQDNGSWLGFGGPTWYYVDSGDGGAMAFQHDEPYLILTTWQGEDGSKRSLDRISLEAWTETEIAGIPRRDRPNFLRSPLPDVPGTGPIGAAPFLRLVAHSRDVTDGFQLSHRGIFGGRLKGHPARRDHWIMAREGAAYVSKPPRTLESNDGPEFQKLNLPALQKHSAGNDTIKISAIAYARSAPDTEWWIGTSEGEVFRTDDGGTTWSTSLAPAAAPDDLRGLWISDISVHPANSSIVAMSAGDAVNNIYISGDKGATWRAVRGIGVADRLFGAPVTSVLIDPRGPAGVGAADLQTLYVGTIAGVYVSRNITPDPAGPSPVWRTLNTGMPLLLVRDIDYGEMKDAGGAVIRRFLRAATYGRGAYELDLGPAALGVALAAPTTPPVRLLIRSTVIDDGRQYVGAARLGHDPRLRTHSGGTPTTLQPHKALDIRVDAPPFSFFERELDGVEFDEDLRNDTLVNGERNFVYVQVHNNGYDMTNGVLVHLYFANATGAGAAPDLDAGFGANFPNLPAPGATWQKAGEVTLNEIGPAQPRVARFDWTPPATLGEKVALFALCSHAASDNLSAPQLANANLDPQAHHDASLIIQERRAALRIVDAKRFVPRLYVRDVVGDTVSPGSVAWGGRSCDIIISDVAIANPDATLTDIADPRDTDKIIGKGGGAGDVTNFIYVRIFNPWSVPISTFVDLYYVHYDKLATPADWIPVGTAAAITPVPVNNVPARAFKFATAFELKNPSDPAIGRSYKAALLVALIGSPDDPMPNKSTITNLDTFWRFFMSEAHANNAAFRGVRYEPRP